MIEIWAEEVPAPFQWSPTNYLGGTPETVVNLAENFDDEVFVYYDGPAMQHKGVYYLPRDNYLARDILIAFNSKPERLAKYNIALINWFHARQENYAEFNERIVLSPYHQSIFGPDSRVIPHTCDQSAFSSDVKIKGQCLFSSSPDRGRDFLESIWPEIEKRTQAKLITTYSKDISEEEMIELYNTSQFWLHPGDGIELYCIAAAKAQAAKCIPIVVPNMALDTTVQYGIKTTKDKFKEEVINAIENPPLPGDVVFPSWKAIADLFLLNVGVPHVT